MTAAFRSHCPLRLGHFQRFLRALPANVLRVKGFVLFEELPGRVFTLQMCGRRYECSGGLAAAESPDVGGGAMLVLIGPGIDREALLEGLQECGGSSYNHVPGGGGRSDTRDARVAERDEEESATFMDRVRRDQRLEPLEASSADLVAFTLSGNFQPLGQLTSGLHSATVAHLQGELALAGAFTLPVPPGPGGYSGLTCAVTGGGLDSAGLWSLLSRALVSSLSRALEDAEQIAQGVDPDLEEQDLALLHRFNAMQALMYSS